MKIPLCRSLIHGALFATTASLWSGEAAAQPKVLVAHPVVGAYSQAVALPAPHARIGTGRDSPAAIEPTDTEAWQARDVREKRAAAVMTPQITEAQHAQGLAVFSESVKRLADVEKSDPARALAEYRKFVVGRTIDGQVGVQAAIKISQLRRKLGDYPGALLTCDALKVKFGSEPSSAFLILEKSRVLVDQGHLVEASKYLDSEMPELLQLGSKHYSEICDCLLSTAQTDIDSKAGDKEASRISGGILYQDVEEIYLRWVKKDTIDHLWQRFQALQKLYEKAGQPQRAHELLIKYGDAVLSTTPKVGNMEGAVLSMEMARWLSFQSQPDLANTFFKRVPEFGDGWHTIMARHDQAVLLLNQGKLDEAIQLISLPLNATNNRFNGELAQNSWLAALSYERGQLDDAIRYGSNVVQIGQNVQFQPGTIKRIYDAGLDVLDRAKSWKSNPVKCDVKEISIKDDPSYSGKSLSTNLIVKVYGGDSVKATIDNPAFQVDVFPNTSPKYKKRPALNAQEKEFEIIIRCDNTHVDKNAHLTLTSVANPASIIVGISLSDKGSDSQNEGITRN